MTVFRVFLRNGTAVDVEAETFGRDGEDWVLYDSRDMVTAGEASRYPSTDVAGIALHEQSAAAR